MLHHKINDGKGKTDIIFEEQERHCHIELGEVICITNNKLKTAMTSNFGTNRSEAGYIFEYIHVKIHSKFINDLNSLLHIILDSHYNLLSSILPRIRQWI